MTREEIIQNILAAMNIAANEGIMIPYRTVRKMQEVYAELKESLEEDND